MHFELSDPSHAVPKVHLKQAVGSFSTFSQHCEPPQKKTKGDQHQREPHHSRGPSLSLSRFAPAKGTPRLRLGFLAGADGRSPGDDVGLQISHPQLLRPVTQTPKANLLGQLNVQQGKTCPKMHRTCTTSSTQVDSRSASELLQSFRCLLPGASGSLS